MHDHDKNNMAAKKLEIQSADIYISCRKNIFLGTHSFLKLQTQALKEITIAWQLDTFNYICFIYQVEL